MKQNEQEKWIHRISEDAPTGADIRHDAAFVSQYHALKDLRSDCREAERREGLTLSDSKLLADWQQIAKESEALLMQTTQDMELACWLTESWLRIEQLPGLARGFDLLQGMLSAYGRTIWPRSDEGNAALYLLNGLNGNDYAGTLIQPLQAIFVTKGDTPTPLWQWRQATADRNHETLLADIQKRRDVSASTFYAALLADLEAAQKGYAALMETVAHYYPASEIRSSQITHALTDINDQIRFLLQGSVHAALLSAEESKEETTVQTEEASILTAAPAMSGEIRSRDQALKTLLSVARFFETTEPHSPLPYLLKRAVRWGNLPLPELMRELITDSNARDRFLSLTGMGEQEQRSSNV